MRNSIFRWLPLVAILLAACGGGGGGSTPTTSQAQPDSVFVSDNAWGGPTPASSETIAPEEFRRRVASGELIVAKSNAADAQRSERQKQFDADRSLLEGLATKSAALSALLDEVHAAGGADGDRAFTLPNGSTVVGNGVATRLHNAATAYRNSQDVELARQNYATVYSLLSADAQSSLPTPASLNGASLDAVTQAASQLNDVLASKVNLDNVRIEPAAPPLMQLQFKTGSGPGSGSDNDGVCTPTNLYARYWFPLKHFLSPVKQQGKRGTCWAFAAVASIESRELVQNNNAVDISEQYFVYKAKREWSPSDFVDGGSSNDSLKAAVDRNQNLMVETAWTYNPAYGRPDSAFDPGVEGQPKSYADTCKSFNGWCTESAHQSPGTCSSNGLMTVCAFGEVPFSGAAITPSRARQIWMTGQQFELNEYRALLAAGYSLIADFPVYEGFRNPGADGLVSDYARQKKDGSGKLIDGSYGGHLAQIVGFVSNVDMSFAGTNANVGGGGYFIVRNSWGCTMGDGGFFYVPADYVSNHFASLSVLDFDSRRSSQWSSEQSVPGVNDPLTLDTLTDGDVFDLRVPSSLTNKFIVKHPSAYYAHVTIKSALDGVIYDGQWIVNTPAGGGLFTNSVPVTFQTPGPRRLIITATYGTQSATGLKDVMVVNSPPGILLETNGTPAQGEPFAIRAIAMDLNEPNQAVLCDRMQWQVTAPDTISGEGCLRTIRFGAQGGRAVTVRTTDTEGVEGAGSQIYNVAPPPVNPYPRVTDSGVFARNTVTVSGQQLGCTFPRVSYGATIDLRDLGCSTSIGSVPTRYFASVTVENPSNETLSYDFTYNIYDSPTAVTPSSHADTHTLSPTLDLKAERVPNGTNAALCEFKVRVNAPEASRSKSLTLWSGRCINLPVSVN